MYLTVRGLGALEGKPMYTESYVTVLLVQVIDTATPDPQSAKLPSSAVLLRISADDVDG